MTVTLAPDDAGIAKAARLLATGALVAFPTETVYGAAGLLSNESATQRLRAIRGGEPKRPFTIHLPHRDDASIYLGNVPDHARRG